MGKPPEIIKVGAPDWIVTFTDLTSLLTTFFVLLLTFSSMEPQEQSKNAGPDDGSPSPLTEKISMLQQHYAPPVESANNTKGSEDKEKQNLSNKGGANPVSLMDLQNGRRVVFDKSFNFKMGLAQVGKKLEKRIAGLASQLHDSGVKVVVVGYADGREHKLSEIKSSGDLALQRALQVSRIFLKSGWKPYQVSVRAQGSDKLFVRGEREKRRRVELLIKGKK